MIMMLNIFHIAVGLLCIFCLELSIEVLCPFSVERFVFLLLIYLSALSILDINS
jgi:hypothetical protein